MINKYFKNISILLEKVQAVEKNNMSEAANKIAATMQNDGIIHLFGSGHSHLLALEAFYRAGGLVAIHPILQEELMLHKDPILSSTLERRNNYAQHFMEKQDIKEGDTLFVISTSGRNPVPIDVALFGREKKAFVIGLTSVEYSKSQDSKHISGKHLYEVVDLIIDSHAPKGDALLTHDKVSMPFSPSSTVIGATIINAIISKAIATLAEKGIDPPIFLSGNIEGADKHNEKLIVNYKKRISLLQSNT